MMTWLLIKGFMLKKMHVHFILLSEHTTPLQSPFCNSVGGVKVSIVAFQAIDPGSIPGWRIILGSNKLLFDNQPSQKVQLKKGHMHDISQCTTTSARQGWHLHSRHWIRKFVRLYFLIVCFLILNLNCSEVRLLSHLVSKLGILDCHCNPWCNDISI